MNQFLQILPFLKVMFALVGTFFLIIEVYVAQKIDLAKIALQGREKAQKFIDLYKSRRYKEFVLFCNQWVWPDDIDFVKSISPETDEEAKILLEKNEVYSDFLNSLNSDVFKEQTKTIQKYTSLRWVKLRRWLLVIGAWCLLLSFILEFVSMLSK
jgi:exonuclease III